MPKETVYNTWSEMIGRLIEHPQLGVGLVTDYAVYPSSGGSPSRRTYTILWDPELGAIECESSILNEVRVLDGKDLKFPT